MDLELTDKVCIITGATMGIGEATARIFAEQSAKLVISARNVDRLANCADSLQTETGATVEAIASDITSDSEVDKLIEKTLDKFGRIDVLINNAAGVVPTGEFTSISNDQYLSGWNEKLQAHLRCCKAVLPIMQDQQGGVILNVLGLALRQPHPGYLAVGASNAALANITKTLADIGAPDSVRVLAVAPAGVMTERWQRLMAGRAETEGKTLQEIEQETYAQLPFKRMAEPEEMGNVICFLASPKASYMSGCIIPVDGNSTVGVYL
jgi:3-oxoacyl-[acyl-carrier protein] reductase